MKLNQIKTFVGTGLRQLTPEPANLFRQEMGLELENLHAHQWRQPYIPNPRENGLSEYRYSLRIRTTVTLMPPTLHWTQIPLPEFLVPQLASILPVP